MKTNSLSNAGFEPPAPMAATSRRPAGGRVYLAIWLLLAAGATVYLVALALAPGQLTALFGTPKVAVTEPNGDETTNDVSTAALLEDFGRLERELEQVRGEVRTLVATNQSLTERLETIESASIQIQGGEAATVPIAKTSKSQLASTEEDGITGIVIGDDGFGSDQADVVETDVPDPSKKPAKKSTERVTEDADQSASEEPAAAPEVKKKSFGLELAVSTSPEALQLNWDLLNQRHGNLLKGLAARAQPDPGDPSSYRLVAGPFTNAQQAQSLCAKLKKNNVTCQVTGFGGENL